MLAPTLDGVEAFAGAVALASVAAPVVLGRGSGKVRPVVLLGQAQTGSGSGWLTAGLTTIAYHEDGEPRVELPDLHRIGLSRRSWVWSPKPTWVTEDSVLGVVWAATRRQLLTVAVTLDSWAYDETWARDVHRCHVAGGWSWPRPNVEVAR